MSGHDWEQQRSWWQLLLAGILALAFGIAAVVLPASILSARVLDATFGVAKPFSASVTAVAALLALVALVATDGLVNLFGKGVTGKHGSLIRGFVGVVIAIAAIFWPGQTVFVAVELIGFWAILIGILEVLLARYSTDSSKDRALRITAAIAAIAAGIGLMRWAFVGAIAVSALVGIAAAARGTSLIMIGVSRRLQEDRDAKQVARRDAA